MPRCNSIDAMRYSVSEWSLAKNSGVSFEFNRCGLQGFSKEQVALAGQVLNDLVAAGALPGGTAERCCLRLTHSSAQAQVEILEAMAKENLAECVFHSSEHSSWQLTKQAVVALKLTVTAQQPRLLFSGRTLSLPRSCLSKIT